jgi:hypothetical protein
LTPQEGEGEDEFFEVWMYVKCQVALCLSTFKCHLLDFTLLYLVPKESFPSFENFQMIALYCLEMCSNLDHGGKKWLILMWLRKVARWNYCSQVLLAVSKYTCGP